MNNRYIKKRFPIEIVIVLGVILFILGYLLSGIYKFEDHSLVRLTDELKYIFTHPFENWFSDKTWLFWGMALVATFAISAYLMTHIRDFHTDVEHGDASWLDAQEATKAMADSDDSYNRILSSNLKISLRSALSNNNMLIVGSSGSYKTTAVVEPNLMQYSSNYIMLDVKGLTQEKLGASFIKKGYKVMSLNLKEPLLSDRYNPFQFIETDQDLKNIVEALYEACYKSAKESPGNGSNEDPFWPLGCKLYLQALFYYIWLEIPKEEQNLNKLLELTALENILKESGGKPGQKKSELFLRIEELARIKGPDYPPVRDYRALQRGSDKTVQSILVMVNSFLGPLNLPEVKRIFSGNDINFRELALGVGGTPKKAGGKVVLFLVIPDTEEIFNFIISMFYTQMFAILCRIADTDCGGPLPVPVEVWMDEFYAGAKPANALKLFGLVRSRNISMIAILQSVAQVKDLYGTDKFEIIADNTATVLFLSSGPGSDSTHKWISELLGTATADSVTDSESKGSGSNRNYSKVKIPLMDPYQVARLPEGDCLVFMQGKDPVYDQKAIPFDRLDKNPPIYGSKELKNKLNWARSFGPYRHPVEVEAIEQDGYIYEYVTIDNSSDNGFFEVAAEDAARYEEMAQNPKIPVHKEKLCNGSIVYYLTEKPSIDTAQILAIARDASRNLQENIFEVNKTIAVKDPDVAEDIIAEYLWDAPPHRDWSVKPSLSETMQEYWPLMGAYEKELTAKYISKGFDEASTAQFIVSSIQSKVKVLSLTDSSDRQTDKTWD